jgi:hypothetical protein
MNIIIPNYFILDKDNDIFLFFDIFYKNNLIYIICPIYYEHYTNIKFFYKNNLLEINNNIIKQNTKNEASQIIIYNINNTSNEEEIEIYVIYNNLSKNFKLKHIITTEKNYVIATTLFKNDYKLIPIYYNYYSKLGITKFYLYYNGIINEEILKYCNYPNVYLFEWNFKYWNDKKYAKYINHAQLGQLNHSLYYNGKQNFKYMLFNDLDEYINLNNDDLMLILQNYNAIKFNNIFSVSNENYDFPDKIPKVFYIYSQPSILKMTKWIYDVNIVNSVGIHDGSIFNIRNKHIKINDKYFYFHFYKWSNINKKYISDDIKPNQIVYYDNFNFIINDNTLY